MKGRYAYPKNCGPVFIRAAKIRQGENNNNRRNPQNYFSGSTTFLSPTI